MNTPSAASFPARASRGPTSRAYRQRRIADLLQAEPGMTLHQLAQALEVHPATVRADLNDLEHRGLIRRDHGTISFLASLLPSDLQAPSGRLSFSQRRDHLLGLLAQNGPTSIAQLAQQLNVHEITLRRDVKNIGNDLVTLQEGRVTLQPTASDLPHLLRRDLNAHAKSCLAQRALAFVTEGMTVGLDASTTCLALARLLRERPVTVVTPGLDAVEALLGGRAIVQMPGGTFHPASRSVHGLTDALPTLDLAFISCTALSLDGWFEDAHPEEAAVKRQLLHAARQRVALLDHTKLARRAAHQVARAETVDTILLQQGSGEAHSSRWPIDSLRR